MVIYQRHVDYLVELKKIPAQQVFYIDGEKDAQILRGQSDECHEVVLRTRLESAVWVEDISLTSSRVYDFLGC